MWDSVFKVRNDFEHFYEVAQKERYGRWILLLFFHEWLQPVSAEGGARKQTSAKSFFFSLSLIMGALKSTRSFFITAEARSSRWVSDG